MFVVVNVVNVVVVVDVANVAVAVAVVVNVVLTLLVKTYGSWVLVLELRHVAKNILLGNDTQQTTAGKRETATIMHTSCLDAHVHGYLVSVQGSSPTFGHINIMCM